MTLLVLLACDRGFTDPTREFGDAPEERVYPVVVHQPAPPVLTQPLADAEREVPAGAACSTCHEEQLRLDAPRYHPTEVQHGGLACDACHDPTNRTRLHLADGTGVTFPDVTTLCAQCHGSTWQDYANGAHGGASGHWDLRVGPQVRNGCLDCHGAHDARPEQVEPVFPPNDRGLR
jgi:hypothetical protein